MRLSGGEDWYQVGLERHIDGGEIKHHLGFRAEYDSEALITKYSLDTATIMQFDKDWDLEVVRRLLHIPPLNLGVDESGAVSVIRTPNTDPEEDLDDLWDEGYFAVEHNFYFTIPHDKPFCRHSKNMSLIIIDEDGDKIDADIGYCFSPLIKETLPDDIEKLVRFGETIADIPKYEEEMSQVTIADLQYILDYLKRLGLVRSTCKVLSNRAQI